MKRDMDLVRNILQTLDAGPTGYAPEQLTVEGYDDEQIGFHVLLMIEAGLLVGGDVTHMGASSPVGRAERITWEGYEFLATSRDDTVWDKAKRAAGASGELAFGVLKAALSAVGTAEAMKHLGLK